MMDIGYWKFWAAFVSLGVLWVFLGSFTYALIKWLRSRDAALVNEPPEL